MTARLPIMSDSASAPASTLTPATNRRGHGRGPEGVRAPSQKVVDDPTVEPELPKSAKVQPATDSDPDSLTKLQLVQGLAEKNKRNILAMARDNLSLNIRMMSLERQNNIG